MYTYHKSQSRLDHLPSEDPVGQGSSRSLVLAPELSPSTYVTCHKESMQPLPSTTRDWHCPVCLQMASFPVQTNCGHLFCAPCLIAYWRHGSWLDAISCPLCRQKVSALCHLFNESRSDRQSKEVLGEITDYNKRYSGAPRRITDYLSDAPLLVQLLARGLSTMGGLVWLFFFRVALCCIGTVVSVFSSPVDPVSTSSANAPETDPSLRGLLGILDDLVVVILLFICVININQQMVPEREGHSRGATGNSPQTAVGGVSGQAL
ncbi:E3 ubiquitin-protein ligase RNF170 [Mastacembelus armatus]|uniref:Si:dkey-183n20.15 n=1 Tax=Mastacembelus armatus TaxID=205130 RepID=A0A3Q3SJU2_9TELE|nr:E3 ubiquitin-protein ligase RNF170-like [Mastacembelus armatus]